MINRKIENNEKIVNFLQKLVINSKQRDFIEKSARRQVNNSAWKELRKGICEKVLLNKN